MSCNDCAFILVLGVKANSIFFTGNPEQWPGQAEHGLAQEDAYKKKQAQGLASIWIGAEALSRNRIIGEKIGP